MSGAFSPGVGSAGSSSSSCSGGCFDADQVKVQYLAGYFNAHMLPAPSYRYVYILWFVTIFVCLVLGLAHWVNFSERSYIGAVWKKWATRNRVYKVGKRSDIYGNPLAKTDSGPGQNGNSYPPKSAAELGGYGRQRHGPPKQRKIFTFPSFGRLILLFFMLAVPIVLTLVGADFIGPNVGVFDLRQSWPGRSPTNTLGLAKRAYQVLLQKRVLWGIGGYPAVTTVPPTITLPYRTWWTIGDRTGDIGSALIVIVVVMALKQIPFALLSTRMFGGYAFDRLSFLHKWGGRIVWLFLTAHMVTWTIQLNKDQRLGEPVWSFVFMWGKFRWAWVSYGFLTAMMLLSIGSIRAHFYEFFYIAHIVTFVGFMITAILHHPPLAQWFYIPLAWWGADRISRAVKIAWVNGLGFAGRKPQFALSSSQTASSLAEKEFATLAYAESSRDHGSSKPGSVSSHKFGSTLGRESELAHFLPGFAPYSSAQLYSRPSTAEGQQQPYGTTLGGQDPASAQSESEHAGNVERRATKMSARYDPVHDLIHDYASRRGSDGEVRPQSVADEPVRYALEGSGSATMTSSESQQVSRTREISGSYAAGSNFAQPSPIPPSRGVQSQPGPSRMLKPRPAMPADVAALIRPGFAFVQLLPGKTLRLTLRTPNKMSWRPGQWVYLNLPGVRWFESHPFTIASAHDADFPVSTEFADLDEEKGAGQTQHGSKGEERTMVLIIRARKGFTSHLWNHVVKRRQAQIEAVADARPGASLGGLESSLLPPAAIGKGTTGVHMRAIVDGPYGSSKRTNWGVHSTVVIVCGGSGVSFGMAALEHLCACIVGAERLGKRGKGGKHFEVQRIRFVWIVREFAHLQWIAAPLRRCIEMMAPEQLSVELFVTHYQNQLAFVRPPSRRTAGSDFAPPSVPFGTSGTRDSFMSATNDYPPSFTPHAARITDGPEQEEYEVTAYDLTHFDGEDESGPTAAEMEMSERIRSEGRLRRAQTRKRTLKHKHGRGLKGLVSRRPSTDKKPAEWSAAASAYREGGLPADGAARPPTGHRQTGSLVGERDLGDRPAANDFVPSSHARDDSLGLELGQASRPRVPVPVDRTGPPAHGLGRENRPNPLALGPPLGARPGSGSGSYLSAATPNSASGLNGFFSPGPSAPPSPYLSHSRRNSGSLASFAPPPGGYLPTPSGTATPRFDSTASPAWEPHSLAAHPYGAHDAPGQQSTAHLVSDGLNHARGHDAQSNDVPIDLDDEEDLDLRVIAELARPGHPRLDRIVKEEVENSRGRILVANCGPKSLDAVLRSIVSKQINLERVRRGDLRGHVNVVSECFEWGG